MLATGRIQAIGFAAELRRLTTAWYAHKFGVGELWGEVRPGEATAARAEEDDSEQSDQEDGGHRSGPEDETA